MPRGDLTWTVVLASTLTLGCQRGRPAAEPGAEEPASVSDEAAATVGMTLRLRGHDRRPLVASHVTVRRAGYVGPVADVEVGGEGVLALELPGPGAYMVTIAGVDHAQIYRHLLVGSQAVELDAQLGTYARDEAGDRLGLRLRWTNADGELLGVAIDSEAVRASPDDDHRLSVEVPSGAVGLQYQLTSLAGGRTFNGPGGRRWVYGGGGDYWAELPVGTGATLELVVDLDALPVAGLPAEVSVRGAELYPLFDAHALLEPVWPRFEAEGDAAIPAIAADARTAIEAAQIEAPLLAKLAAIEWLLFFVQFVPDQAIPAAALTWVLEVAPPEDPAWMFYSSRLDVLGWADAPEFDAALAAMAAHHRDPGLRAAVDAQALYTAQRRGQTEGLADAYAALVRDYPGTVAVEYAKVAFDPDRPLQIGRPMPDWRFVGLDGETPIASSDLRGQPYLFELWASWCGLCVEDMASIHAAYAAINPDPERPVIEFVAVSVDHSPDDVAKFREQWPMPWRHAWLDPESWRAHEQRWLINAIPTVVLVDADGVIVDLDMAVRREQLLPRLERFLAEAEAR